MFLRRFLPLFLLTICPAVANTIIVVGTDSNLGENIFLREDGSNESAWAGGIDVKVDGHNRVLFCVDLFVEINSGGTYNTALDFADTANLKRVAWLLNNYYPTNAVTGAGLQLAIWDIMSDNGDGFTSGLVRKSTSNGNPTNATVLADAIQYEALSVGKSSTNAVVYHNFTIPGGAPAQTLIGLWPTDGGPIATPEPASIFMILGGLALIGLGRFRRGSH
jgi:hypothetical protein